MMKSSIKFQVVFLLVAVIFCSSWFTPVHAAPVTYIFTGTGTGYLRNIDSEYEWFNEASFKFLFYGDTNNIQHNSYQHNIYGLSGTIEITGVGTGRFLTDFHITVDKSNTYVGFWDTYSLWCYLYFPAMETYDLTTSIGPLTDPFGIYSGYHSPLPLDIGSLIISGSYNGTFQAVVSPVPLPGTFLLVGIGLLRLGSFLYQRRY
jgi:hypothetical protein